MLEVGKVRHLLASPGLVIGRDSNADLRVNDPEASRCHAVVSVPGPLESRITRTEDLGLTNGIIADGSQAQAVQLRDSSYIETDNARALIHSSSEA